MSTNPADQTSEEIAGCLKFAKLVAWMKAREGAPDAEQHAKFVMFMFTNYEARAAAEGRTQESIDQELAEVDDWVREAQTRCIEIN